MPKDSVIVHQQSYYLEFRRDYVDLFDGDHCAAVLMSFFEFMTNGEITRMRTAGEDGEPWVKASMGAICEETLGLYSVRSLQDRIGMLEQHGILKTTGIQIGSIRKYLLDVPRITDVLKRRVVLKKSIGNISDGENQPPSEATSEATSAKTAHEAGVYIGEEQRTNNIEPSVGSQNEIPGSEFPTNEPEEVYLEDEPREFYQNAVSRERVSIKLKFTTAQGERDLTKLHRKEEIRGRYEVRVAFLHFLRMVKATKPDIRNYVDYFCTAIDVWIETSERSYPPGRPKEPLTSARMLQMPSPAPAPQEPLSAPEQESLPETVQRWNTEVQAGAPVRIWPPGPKERCLLATAVQDQRFVNNLNALLEECQRLLSKGNEKSKLLNFFWMLGNWQKILNGQCNWMLSGDFGASPRKPMSEVDKTLEEVQSFAKKKRAEKAAREAAMG